MNVWALCRTYGLPPRELDLPPIPGFDTLMESPDAARGTPAQPAAGATLEPEAQDTNRRDLMRYGLGAGLPLLGSLAAVVDWERFDTPAGGASAIDERSLSDLEAVIRWHWDSYQGIAPGALLPAVAGCVAHLLPLTRQSLRRTPGLRIRSMAGDAASLAGWLCMRLENRTATAAYWALAEALATEAENESLRRFALASRSSLYSSTLRGGHDGDTRLAIALLTASLGSPAPVDDPIQRAWIFARRAEEHSVLGDSGATARDLEESERCLGVTRAEPEGYFAGWDEAQLAGYRGSCALALGSTDAVAMLDHSLARTDVQRVSQRAAILTNLGAAHAQRAHVEEACSRLTQALAIAHDASLVLAKRRVHGVRRRLDPWSSTVAVRQFDELMASLG